MMSCKCYLRLQWSYVHFRYVLAVAEEKNFSRAAERLHVVQSALSMQIRDLEEELGAQLFRRGGRNTELTEAGVLFSIEAERTIAQADRAKEMVGKAARGEAGSVRIGFVGNAAVSGKLSGDLKRFRTQYPQVEVQVRELMPLHQAEAIYAGQLDLGYCSSFGSLFETELASDVLDSWPWVIAMAEDHSLAAKDKVRREDLVNEPFVLYAASGEDAGHFSTLWRLIGSEPRIAHRFTNTLTGLAMAAAGVGLALAPAPLMAVNMPNLVFREISGFSEPTTLILLSRKSGALGAAEAFRTLALPV